MFEVSCRSVKEICIIKIQHQQTNVDHNLPCMHVVHFQEESIFMNSPQINELNLPQYSLQFNSQLPPQPRCCPREGIMMKFWIFKIFTSWELGNESIVRRKDRQLMPSGIPNSQLSGKCISPFQCP